MIWRSSKVVAEPRAARAATDEVIWGLLRWLPCLVGPDRVRLQFNPKRGDDEAGDGGPCLRRTAESPLLGPAGRRKSGVCPADLRGS